ncbi:putative disease resistance RPP13-like protein 1 [Forsythia ovata]|uniref:Disease resistance RPP13-like protein 1 n=1 Tax=Forsythia ovata TaxID=205694 RepID=A0ABD1TAV9_9LAMI
MKAWACVSDEFDVMRITKTLVESATKKTCDLNNLELLQEKLVENLKKKKFLLVLDDVWNEKPGLWEVLQVPFGVGAPGSCVIVTTRNESVASMMGTIPIYRLRELSKDDSWSLLENVAFPNKDAHAYPGLKIIGEEIAKKCKGLPLAAKALGGLLRSKLDEDHWNDILHSNMWDNLNSGILPSLRLSYHYLPARLKQCFAYCSMFPKDYEFDVEKLVFLWMAEGFVQETEGNKKIEDVGRNYFDDLLSRSFFQQCSDDESRFLIHDLIHDLAQYVFGKICLRLEDHIDVVKKHNVPVKARHLSYIRGPNDTFFKFEPISDMKCLRTFLPLDQPLGFNFYCISGKVLGELLPELRFLRVLSLSGYQINEVPDTISNLRHLRYLDLSYTSIKELPESVSNLYNLQTLLLLGCHDLAKLPKDMGNLLKLRHLIIDQSCLEKMPSRIGRLIYLQTLSYFIVGEGSESSIGEFKDLRHLRGSLSISGLQKSKTKEAIDANLEVKQHLEELSLEWTSRFDDGRKGKTEEEVLDALQPHINLRKLTIKDYGGKEFPSWVCDPSFEKMTHVHLYGCKKCEALPSFGQLPSLKDLIIEGMDSLEVVGFEIFGDEYLQSGYFPSLETLKFENLKEWKEWLSFEDEVKGFRKLCELTIIRCPKLKGFSFIFPSLKKLRVKSCEEFSTFSKPPSIPEGTSGSLPGYSEAINFPQLHMLILVGCPNLNELPTSLLSLQVLEIDGCNKLAGFPMLSQLRNFVLMDCGCGVAWVSC